MAVVVQQIEFKVWLTGANRETTAVQGRGRMPIYEG